MNLGYKWIKDFKLPNSKDMKEIDLKHIKDKRGSIDILEDHINFNINRVFFINAPAGSIRGGHGHKKCKMLLVCPKGKIEIVVNNGSGRERVLLDDSSKAIYLDPEDWHIMNFIEDSVLVVQASQKYNKDDYFYDEPKD